MQPIVIIGAGPYGLSLAAHFRRSGMPFRIFGPPMDSWLAHMPKGMMLKSDGFASNIFDPDNTFTLEQFCTERGIEYSDIGVPVRLETFTAYGLAFQERLVPELEENLVVSLDRLRDGFLLRLDSGETVETRRVVLAIGITHFKHVPANLAHLSPEFLSHSFYHHDLERFRGRRVVVIGGGASGIDLAGLLNETGADVELVASQKSLNFHDMQPVNKPRSWSEQVRRPRSGLGPTWRNRFYSDAPGLFHHLPERLRLRLVRRTLPPAGGWFAKEKVMGRLPLVLGYTPRDAKIRDGKVRLYLRGGDRSEREILTEHIIAATGYKVNLGRLGFLSTNVRSELQAVNGSPVLSGAFESSLPGLYFVGVAAASSFGPVMRFAFGAGFAARRVTQTMKKSLAHGQAFSAVPSAIPTTK
jgi:cation diffusion facilitator CzcD-associated flavoprotein CzcO